MSDDIDDALIRLRALIGPDQDPTMLIAFVHAGPPISKARARMGSGKFMYTPKRTMRAEESLSQQFRMAGIRVGEMGHVVPIVENVAIIAVFYRPNRQRIDGDNLMKLVMDSATHSGVWRDDSQVTAHAALIELDEAHPRTVIALCPYTCSLVRTPVQRTCAKCGRTYERAAWDKTGQRYCSGACAQARRLAEATCPRCNHSFRRKIAAQVYCSMACRNMDRGKRLPNGEQRPPATCEKCGALVSKRGYQQCRACRGYGRPKKAAPTPLLDEGGS